MSTLYPVTQRLLNHPITRTIINTAKYTTSSLHTLAWKLYQLALKYKYVSGSIFGVLVILLYFVIRAIRRITHRYPRNLALTDITNQTYDFIIVGAGSSGAVVANRLSEDPKNSVLLIEAGGEDSELMHHIPVAALQQQLSPCDWQYRSTPQKHSTFGNNNNVSHWPRGRVLGGCSTTNYMLYVRGNAADYDRYETVYGCTGWNYNEMLPCFKRMETLHGSIKHDKSVRGTDGPMHVQLLPSPGVVTETFVKAAVEAGIPYNEDYNGNNQLGVSHAQVSHYQSRRWNTASGYIIPALDRPNLHVKTYTTCARVLFDGNKHANGIAFKVGVTPQDVATAPEQYAYCRKEVTISAGAVGSPQILQLSGIGDAKLLKALNIPVVVDNPAVGDGLQDHMFAPVSYECKLPTLSKADETLTNVIKWFHGYGPFTSTTIEALIFARSKLVEQNDSRPDIQIHFANASNNSDYQAAFNTRQYYIDIVNQLATTGKYQFAAMPTMLHPYSRGYIKIQSNDCTVHPIIEPNYLSDQRDIDTFVEAYRMVDKIVQQPALQAILGTEVTPDKIIPDNPYISTKHLSAEQEYKYYEYAIRHAAITVYHPVGTCKMGRSDDSTTVVTSDCKVKGVTGLRVVDASVFPELPSGNTNVPCIVAGERAADIIKAEYFNRHKDVVTKTTIGAKL